MFRNDIETAQEGLNLYNQELSGAYDLVRQRLAGSLAVSARTLEEIRAQRESVHPNTDFVREFVSLLPLRDYGDALLVGDPYVARMIEGHVLWSPVQIHAGSHYDKTTREKVEDYLARLRPYFVLGERPSPTDRRKTELLVLQAREAHSDFFYAEPQVVEVWTGQKKAADQTVKERVVKDYTEEELKAMNTGRSLKVGAENVRGYRFVADTRLILQGDLDRVVRKLGGIHMSEPRSLEEGLTNQALAEFGVPDRLNRLALAFGKVEGLQDLFEKFKATAQDHPLDQHFEA